MNGQRNSHIVDILFMYLDTLNIYPKGVIRIPGRIPGTAFFPGGSGLWNTRPNEPLPSMPVGGVMIVGHNFDSETGFQRSFKRGEENIKSPTWGNLLAFLKEVEILPEQCFFTNAYVGLIPGNCSTGSFSGAQDREFVSWCRNFLLEQLQLMQPHLILSLGTFVPRFLAPLSPALSAWSDVTSFKMLDKNGKALVYPCAFAGMEHPVAVVALTHPCYRSLNVRRRRYKNLEGDAAEQALVRDALILIGYQ